MKWPFIKKKPEIKNEVETLDLNDDRLYDKLNDVIGATSNSGPVITATTAMKFSAVYGCVSLLAGTIASLPFEIYDDSGDHPVKSFGHGVFSLINKTPCTMVTAFVFWETMGYCLFLTGNAYALIGRSKLGTPKSLNLLLPGSVTPKYNDSKTRLQYKISLINGASIVVDQDDVLHFPCIGWDGLQGMSPITAAREAIGLGLSGEEYNARYFTNGNTSDVVISYEKGMQQDTAEKLREYLQKRYGGLENAHLPLVLTEGGDAKSLTMTAEDAQLIESRDFQVEDICRFYGVPPHMVGANKKTTSWGTGMEEQTMGFVKFNLRRHLKRIEQEVNRKLIRSPRYYSKFNLDALLRADTKTRYEAYQKGIGGNQVPGWMTPNEARRMEGLPPDPDGNKLYTPPKGGTAIEIQE